MVVGQFNLGCKERDHSKLIEHIGDIARPEIFFYLIGRTCDDDNVVMIQTIPNCLLILLTLPCWVTTMLVTMMTMKMRMTTMRMATMR